MAVIDHRPANGGGSCRRCLGRLGLDAPRADGVWYCSTACAEGYSQTGPREAGVPEHWLYNRPRRFFRKRRPKELTTGSSDR